MHRYYHKRGDKARIAHIIKKVATMEDIVRNVPNIYTTLDNKQAEFQLHMNEVKGNIMTNPFLF